MQVIQLFIGGRMSYLRYLCLFAYNGVQQVLCYVVVGIFHRVVYSMLSSFRKIGGMQVNQSLRVLFVIKFTFNHFR